MSSTNSVTEGYEKDISRAIAKRTIYRAEDIEKMIVHAKSVDTVLRSIEIAARTGTDVHELLKNFTPNQP